MDMVILVTRDRDQAMEHLDLMVLDHMDPDQVHLVDHLDSILAIPVRDSIHPKVGMDQTWEPKVLLLQANQVALLATLE